MDPFSYLSVLLSIILGLAITQILKGFRGIVLARGRVRMSWLPVGWAVLMLVINIQTWWAMFGLRNVQVWTFPGFAAVLVHCILLYMLAGLVLPDFFGEDEIELRKHYFGHHRILFSLALVTLGVSLGQDLVLDGHLTSRPNLTFHGIFAAIALAALVSAREWLHRLVLIAFAAAFIGYIGELFAHLGQNGDTPPATPAHVGDDRRQ